MMDPAQLLACSLPKLNPRVGVKRLPNKRVGRIRQTVTRGRQIETSPLSPTALLLDHTIDLGLVRNIAAHASDATRRPGRSLRLMARSAHSPARVEKMSLLIPNVFNVETGLLTNQPGCKHGALRGHMAEMGISRIGVNSSLSRRVRSIAAESGSEAIASRNTSNDLSAS